MSGAAGHLMHLHENRSLTFNELIDVLTRAAEGNLEQVTEKFDGMNIVFTWDDASSSVRIARNSSDISTGGMNRHELAQRFSARGQIASAFNQAYQVLQQAISSLSRNELRTVFKLEPGTSTWYSAEVIYPSGANTINYDTNCVVFHECPVFEKTMFSVTTTFLASGAFILSSAIDRMQKAIELRGWTVMGPVMVNLERLVDRTALDSAVGRIDESLYCANVTRKSTILEYLVAMAFDRGKMIGLSDNVARQFAKRMTNQSGAPNVTQLIRLSPQHASQLTYMIANDKKIIAEFIRPIELAISDLACQVLKGMHSVLINDADKELGRIRGEVGDAIDAIRETGDIEKITALEKQLLKMRNVDNITSAMEGVVFVYKGLAYKLTGAWAPAHQIVSLYKRSP